jgi:cytochrome c-type biogenesis protein CcmF
MTIHPPSLYIGFVAATIPFAFGVAAMASGRLDDMWLGSVRSWTLVCWFFLSFGLILGGRWAYEELGWGGYWAWDPVENAGLLPWFTATAFLHAVMIQEQRGMMKAWNLVLVITTFFLTIFGTFMTRSGVVQSVHAFGEDNQLALLFILFMGVILVVSFGLLVYRLPQLRSTGSFESLLSREFAFLLNNWILLGSAIFVLFATMFPTLSEAVTGERITVGPPFFNKWMIPLGLTLLFLAGAAPLLAWRRTTRDRLSGQFLIPLAVAAVTVALLAFAFPVTRVRTSILSETLKLPISLINFGMIAFTLGCIVQEFVRGARVRSRQTGSGAVTSLIGLMIAKRRKYGGYIIHGAIAVMFFGFAGKAYEDMLDFTVSGKGETFSARGYDFVYDSLDIVDTDWAQRAIARVTLKSGDQVLKNMAPERRQYKKVPDQPTTEVDMYSSFGQEGMNPFQPNHVGFFGDVYLILTGFNLESRVANFRVYFNPLINWVWLGFGLLALGTAICLIPQAWSDRLSARGAPSRSHGGPALLMLLVGGGLTLGLAAPARAQGAPVEHKEAGGHTVGESAAHMYRPDDAGFLAPYKARGADLRPIIALADKVMRDLVCLCGGCSRETLLECRCGMAAEERAEILAALSLHDDLSTEQARKRAYDAVVAQFIAKYETKRKGDGQRVLMMPRDEGFNRLSWVVPYVGLAGALALLYAFGRRWVRQSAIASTAGPGGKAEIPPEDQQYADILDDELRETDD